METISLTREVPSSPAAVREAMADVEAFMRAAGFTEVDVDGNAVHIAQAFTLARIDLSLRVVDDPDADLAYEQVEGIFEEMTTRYTVEPAASGGGSVVTATTEFTLGGPLGSVLDATFVKRKRRSELERQFDYLEGLAAE